MLELLKKSGIRRNHGTCRDGTIIPGLIYGLGEVFNIFSGVGKKRPARTKSLNP